MKKLILLVAFTLVAGQVGSQELATIFKQALEADSQLALLKARYEKAVLDYAYAGRLSPLSLSVATGSQGIGVAWNWQRPEDGLDIFLTPQLSFYAGEAIGTRVTVSLAYQSATRLKPESLAAALSLSQELNRILGLYHSSPANQLSSFSSLEKARLELLNRSLGLQLAILQDLSNLYQARAAIALSKANLIEAEKKYQELLALKTYSPESPSYKLIATEYLKCQAALDSSQRRFERLLVTFNKKYDLNLKELPAKLLEFSELEALKDSGEGLQDIYLAELGLQAARQKLAEQKTEFPKLSLIANYATQPNALGQPSQEFSTGLSFANNSLQASVWGGINSESAIFFKLSFSYSLPDFAKEENELKAALNELLSAEMALATARRDCELELQRLKDSYLDALAELKQAELILEIKRLELVKTKEEYEAGFKAASDVEVARLALQIQEESRFQAEINLLVILLENQKLYLGDTYVNKK